MENKGLVDFVRNAWHASICDAAENNPVNVFKAVGACMEVYVFGAEAAPGTCQIQRFLHAHPDSVVIIEYPGKCVIDIYAQSVFDASPIVAKDVAWENNEELAELGDLPTYLEFAFELDRKFGKRRLEQKFVASFKHYCQKLAQNWENLTDDTQEIRHQLALDTLLRLFFTAFLAARGILDNRSDFLIAEARKCCDDGGSIYCDFLQPLFFETLNRAPHRRTQRVRKFGKIPFLNGGLFTPGMQELMSPRLTAPNEIWIEIFGELFGRYALTTHHSQSNHSLTLDPLMLGHVFETLMRKDNRNATGSYYTPIPMARKVVLDVFRQWFRRETALSEAQIDGICLRDEFGEIAPDAAQKIEEQLSKISILDPAAGSGSFLQCALSLLHRIRTGLQNRYSTAESAGSLARQILSRNLYGVDIVPAARQICELRLWLELMHYFDKTEEIPSLPNLDVNIQCGDALVECGQLAKILGVPKRDLPCIQELSHLKHRYRLSTGPTKKILARRIEQNLQQMSAQMMSQMIVQCEDACRQYRCVQGALFGKAQISVRDRQHLEAIEAQKEKLKNYLEFGLVPGFSFEIHFGDILEQGGFDMVLGNPPWFSLHTMPDSAQNALRALYQTAIPIRGTKAQSSDISALFIEKAIRCARRDGLIAMIVPNKLFNAPSYESFRNHIASHAVIMSIQDLSHSKCNTFAAAAYPTTLILCRTEIQPIFVSQKEKQQPVSTLILKNPSVSKCTIGDFFTVKRGVCTGANDIFIPVETISAGEMVHARMKNCQHSIEIERALVHPTLRGADIRAYGYHPEREIIFTHAFERGMEVIGRLPPHAGRWFEQNREILQLRKGLGRKCCHALFGVSHHLAFSKVVWRDIAPRIEACFVDEPGIIPLNTVYYIAVRSSDLGYLLAAYLNSAFAREFCSSRAEHAQNNYRRFFAWVIEALPWCFGEDPQSEETKEIIELSKQCHSMRSECNVMTRQIDDLVEKCMASVHLRCA
ncbi:MAG: Eco57I restriction-modification methylase domain-containing protein [Proteobacteria bacterium]|nr:Eco57I restriction-modification methylase domain-containing protein [Pseudomonadota bacterium]